MKVRKGLILTNLPLLLWITCYRCLTGLGQSFFAMIVVLTKTKMPPCPLQFFSHYKVERRVEVDDLANIRAKAVEIRDKIQMLPTILVMLKTYRHVRSLYEMGNIGETTKSTPPGQPCNTWTTSSPMDYRELWSFWNWVLAAQIVTHFLDQEVPASVPAFLNMLVDLFGLAGQKFWAIEVVIIVLYFVNSTSRFWATLFRSDLTGFNFWDVFICHSLN